MLVAFKKSLQTELLANARTYVALKSTNTFASISANEEVAATKVRVRNKRMFVGHCAAEFAFWLFRKASGEIWQVLISKTVR